MVIYNNKHLVRIQQLGFIKSKLYKYKPEKKILGLTVVKSGFYCSILGEYSEEIPENHTRIGKSIFENPCIILYYVDRSKKYNSFNTVKEADNFKKRFTDKNWI